MGKNLGVQEIRYKSAVFGCSRETTFIRRLMKSRVRELRIPVEGFKQNVTAKDCLKH